jgi:hypothetical protein
MGWASRQNLLARAVNRNLGGVPVVWGAISGEGILESNAELVSDGNVISVEYVLHNLPVADFGPLRYGDTLSVDGLNYAVREPMVVGDGRFMMVGLELVTLPRLLLEGGGLLLLENDGALLLE